MNPIVQALRGQPNLGKLAKIASIVKNGDPQAIYNEMLNTNPQFKAFVDANKGKSAEQIASENGVDLSMLNQFLK